MIQLSESSYEVVREALRRWGNVRLTEGGWLARCPAHDDRQGSLLVLAAGDGRVELDCLGAGCDPQDVAAALRIGAQYVVVPPPAFEDGPGWIWPGYVPSVGLTLIDGEDGVNTLAVALDVAARASAGVGLPDGQHPPTGHDVVVLTAPHTTADVQRLLVASGADLGRTEVIEVLGGRGGQRGLRLPADLAQVEGLLRGRDAELVVVDVMLACPYRVPAERALRALGEMSKHLGVAVLAVREASKRAGWLASRRAQEAAELGGVAAVHMAVNGPDRSKALVPVASESWKVMGGLQFCQAIRNRPVAWNSRFSRGTGRAIESADLCRRRPASTGAYRFLEGLLAGGPVSAREVSAAAAGVGLAPRTVQRARTELGVVATKTAQGWVLSLPPQHVGR
ncbi:AAA family ATPase [Kitasatospora sp. NPDC085879]|uniref:AAA family ATPase n=1 Tax=Kitasatospora sp. NPDC085879 TaxID=3154769 RepID=UPI00341A3FB5